MSASGIGYSPDRQQVEQSHEERVLIDGAFAAVAEVVVDILFAATGESLIYVATLGQRKPRWDVVALKGRGALALSKSSVLLGAAFWLAVAALITILFMGG